MRVTLTMSEPAPDAFRVGARVDLDRWGSLSEQGHYEIVRISPDRCEVELVPYRTAAKAAA